MKYIKTIIFEFILLLILTIISSILYYFNLINSNIYSILKIINFIIVFSLSGIYIASNSNKKYYIEGIKISIINFLLFTIISLIINNFNIKNITYYLLISFIIIISSIIFGNLKKNKK